MILRPAVALIFQRHYNRNLLREMKIGLVDVDGHAKKKKWGATIYPNLALGKIARYYRNGGG